VPQSQEADTAYRDRNADRTQHAAANRAFSTTNAYPIADAKRFLEVSSLL
jgi:hypothetical protein